MVNTGKPSKACGLCRQRKIKCDQIRPACTQCRRLKTECPGYRSELDLRFKDDSAAAARRILINEQPGSALCPAVVTTSRHLISVKDAPRAAFGVKPAPIKVLDTPLEDLATPFFLNYFFSTSTGPMGRVLIPSLAKAMGKVKPEDAMSAAIAAVGAATLANMHNSERELVIARRKYGLAVQLTGEAVQHPVVSSPFNLVLTVLLLSYFEVVTCLEIDNVRAWSSHLAGAVAILDTYGDVLLKDSAGSSLFIQLRSQIISNCLQRAVTVPNVVTKRSKQIRGQTLGEDEAALADLADLQTELCELRSGILDAESMNDAQRVSALYKLDEKLQKWQDSLPEHWKYAVKRRVPQGDYQSYEYHTYPDLKVATSWNECRTARLIALDHILSHVDYLTAMGEDINYLGSLSEQRASLVHKIRTICFGVCASMPQFLGRTEDNMPAGHAGGLSIIWTLFVFGSQRCIAGQQKLWTARQLESVGREMGVWQALQLARLLRTFGEDRPGQGHPGAWSEYWKQCTTPQDWYLNMRSQLPNHYENYQGHRSEDNVMTEGDAPQ